MCLGGLEAGYEAETRAEYLEAKANISESLEEVRINTSAEDLGEEFNSSDPAAEEDLPVWAKEENAPEWVANLTDSGASASEVNSSIGNYYLSFAGRLLNSFASTAESSGLLGLSIGWRWGYPALVLAWYPFLIVLYASPWIVRAWWRWNKEAARKAA